MGKKYNFAEAYKEQKSAGVDIAEPLNNLITVMPKEELKKPEGIQAVERRTKRVQIVMTPKLYDQVKKEADRVGISFNELINQLCTNLLQKNNTV